MAREIEGVTCPEPDWDAPAFGGKDFKVFFKEQDDMLKKLIAESDKALKEDKLEGVVIRFGVADGFAWYRVVKEKPLYVEYLYVSDGYRINPIMLRGLTKKDILEIAKGDLKFRECWNKKK